MTRQDELADLARGIIDANTYLVLGTADAAGTPWATPVYFATDDYRNFYWISAPGTTHSRNLVVRPQLGIVVFDSTVRPGTGQGVYMSAIAEQLADADVDQALTIYPGPPERGAREIRPEELVAPGPYRMYRATASEHWVLCPDRADCEHGLPHDHRAAVSL